jgi:hypothetical protein
MYTLRFCRPKVLTKFLKKPRNSSAVSSWLVAVALPWVKPAGNQYELN